MNFEGPQNEQSMDSTYSRVNRWLQTILCQ